MNYSNIIQIIGSAFPKQSADLLEPIWQVIPTHGSFLLVFFCFLYFCFFLSLFSLSFSLLHDSIFCILLPWFFSSLIFALTVHYFFVFFSFIPSFMPSMDFNNEIGKSNSNFPLLESDLNRLLT
ncbi:unnamed protein product [Cuscuta epithymum]|uniref:Uncharacterized protein n=1 Tax=Cuscuta epithymum TaxID=186058 RepID=A0AAV0CQV9_9ASTE|nr:unnamed protein product [Cuscuta epithymum]